MKARFFVLSYLTAAQRVDLDGQLLSEILLHEQQGKFARSISSSLNIEQHYPREFIQAFSNILTGDTPLTGESLREIAKVSVSGAKTGCGICFAVVAFLLSTGAGAISPRQLHALYDFVPVHLQEQYSDPVELLYQASMFHGSSFGTLASFRLAMLYEDPAHLCETFATTLGQFAHESASDDVFSTLMPPSEVDFHIGSRPLDLITMEDIKSTSEGWDHLLNTVRENAEALSSVFFDATDFAELVGLNDQSFGDDIKKSAEQIAGSDDYQLGEELLETINMARYNVNAMRYNQALSLLDSDRTCHDALAIFRDIIENQGLFAKSLHFATKASFFKAKNFGTSFFASLMMSESGMLIGHLNTANLLKTQPSLNLAGPYPSSFEFMTAASVPPICNDDGVQTFTANKISMCFDECLDDYSCNFVFFNFASATCNLFSSCISESLNSGDATIHQKSTFYPTTHFLRSSEGGNRTAELYERASWDHNHAESMNWLTYFHESNQEMDIALSWASESSSFGNAEGVFNLGRLSMMQWMDHPPDLRKAKHLFHMLLTYDILPGGAARGSLDSVLTEIEESELSAAREVAEQLGILDSSLSVPFSYSSWSWAQRIGGLGGLIVVFFFDISHVGSYVVTILAVLPIFFFLMTRRVITL